MDLKLIMRGTPIKKGPGTAVGQFERKPKDVSKQNINEELMVKSVASHMF